jgi:hypothetical protein
MCSANYETSAVRWNLHKKRKPFYLYWTSMGLGRVANNNLQKRSTNVTKFSQDLAQNTVLLSCVCLVSLVWTPSCLRLVNK